MPNHPKHCKSDRHARALAPHTSRTCSEQKTFQSRPETYNGAERDLYSWTQTITDIDVRVKVIPHALHDPFTLRLQIPSTIKKGKEVKVTFAKQHIKIDLLEPTGAKTLIDSDLPWPIRSEECTWSLVPGDHIHVGIGSRRGLHRRSPRIDFHGEGDGTLVGELPRR